MLSPLPLLDGAWYTLVVLGWLGCVGCTGVVLEPPNEPDADLSVVDVEGLEPPNEPDADLSVVDVEGLDEDDEDFEPPKLPELEDDDDGAACLISDGALGLEVETLVLDEDDEDFEPPKLPAANARFDIRNTKASTNIPILRML
jgi:hypothetical protein